MSKSKTTTISNPNERPLGLLSNNYVDNILIDNKIYPTITNYILSNTLLTPSFQSIIATAKIKGSKKDTDITDKVKSRISDYEKIAGRMTSQQKETIEKQVEMEVKIEHMDIHDLYKYYQNKENVNIMKKAIETAYASKLKDQEFITALKNTGNNTLVFADKKFNENFSDLIGNVLMQLRQHLNYISSRNKKEETVEKQIIVIYQVYIFLQDTGLTYKNNLLDFIGKSSDTIFKEHRLSFPSKEEQKEILALYKQNLFPFITQELKNPGFLVQYMRKNLLRQVVDKLTKDRNNIITDLYTEYTIKQKYNLRDEDVKKAVIQLRLTCPSGEEYEKLTKRIYSLYKKEKLSQELQTIIQEKIKNINIPSEEELKAAESFDDFMASSSSGSEEEKKEPIVSTIQPRRFGDYIKSLITKDPAEQRRVLIQKLVEISGETQQKFFNMDLPTLQQEFEKYVSEQKVVWIYKLKPPKGPKILLDVSNKELSQKEQKKLVDEYYSSQSSSSSSQSSSSSDDNLKYLYVKKQKLPGQWVYYTVLEGILKTSPVRLDKNKLSTENIPASRIREDWRPIEKIEIQEISEDKKYDEYQPPSEVVFQIPNDHILSPYTIKDLVINNEKYPNIIIYVISELISTLGYDKKTGKRTLINGRVDLIQGQNFVNINDAIKIYNNKKDIVWKQQILSFHIDKAFDIKFRKNESLHIILSILKSFKIILKDEDKIIEKISSEKINEIAKNIQPIRDPTPFKIETISEYINENTFMKEWVSQLTEEMCNVVTRTHKFINTIEYKEQKIEQALDKKFARTVLDSFYPTKTKLNTEIENPDYFYSIFTEKCYTSFNPSRPIDSLPENLKKYYMDNFTITESTTYENLKKKLAENLLGSAVPKKQEDIIYQLEEYVKAYEKIYNKKPSEEEVQSHLKKQDTTKYKKIKTSEELENEYNERIKEIDKIIKSEVLIYEKNIKETINEYWQKILEIINDHSIDILRKLEKQEPGKRKEVSNSLLQQTLTITTLQKTIAKSCSYKENDIHTTITDDSERNCIIIALINIITKLKNIKQKYANVKLSTNELSVAASIFSNKNIKVELELEPIEEQDLEQMIEEAFAEEEELIPEEKFEEEEEIGGYEENEEVAFAMNGPEEENKVCTILRSIDNNIESELCKLFISFVDKIQVEFKTNKKVLNDRINLFA